jgi:hypothetical protein
MYTIEIDHPATTRSTTTVRALVSPDGIDIARSDVEMPAIVAELLGYEHTGRTRYPDRVDLERLARLLNDARTRGMV